MITRQNGPVSDLPDAPTASDGTVVLCGRDVVEVDGRVFTMVWQHTLRIAPRGKRGRRRQPIGLTAG